MIPDYFDLTKEKIVSDSQDWLEFLKENGHLDEEKNIQGLIDAHGLCQYLDKLYGYGFKEFQIGQSLYYDLLIPSYRSLIQAKGSYREALKISNPEYSARFEELAALFPNSDEKLIFKSLQFGSWGLNDVEKASKYLNKEKTYENELKEIIEIYGFTDKELILDSLYEANGKVLDAALKINDKTVYDKVIAKLTASGYDLSLLESDWIYNIRYCETYNNVEAFVKFSLKEPGFRQKAESVIYNRTWSERWEACERHNFDLYKAHADLLGYLDQFNKVNERLQSNGEQISSQCLLYLLQGVDNINNDSEIEQKRLKGNQILEELKSINYQFTDDYIYQSIYRYNETAAFILKGDPELFNPYRLSHFTKLGFSEELINLSKSLLDFEYELEREFYFLSLLKTHPEETKILVANSDFYMKYAAKTYFECMISNNYDPWGTLYDTSGYPPEHKNSKGNTKDSFLVFKAFSDQSGLYTDDRFVKLIENNFDVEKALESLKI